MTTQEYIEENTDINDQDNENDSKFTPGESLSFVRVRFPGHAKSYPFLIGKRKISYGQKVMAMSDRGVALGYVNSFAYSLPFNKNMLPIKSINKIASDEDMKNESNTYKKQKETETLCQNLIDKHKLDMNLTHVEFTQFGKKVVFYFTAPARVDFRNLVKDLVSELKLRIELRQISVRDRSASMGALGPCGRELCCSSFLSKYGNVSIKMAKNQNLTLNYSKLNGVCGQLKCCLQYEDEVYSQKRKNLPEEGSFIETINGETGRIYRLHLLSEQFDLLTREGKIKRYTSNYFKEKIDVKQANMPHRFDHISDETAITIGLTENESFLSKKFESDMERISYESKKYAQEIFTDLTGISTEDQVSLVDPEFKPSIITPDQPEIAPAPVKRQSHSESKRPNNRPKPQTKSATAPSDAIDGEKKPKNKRNSKPYNKNRKRKKKNTDSRPTDNKPKA